MTNGNETNKRFKLHAIRLLKVNVVELSIRSNVPPDESLGINEIDIPFKVGHSEFDEKSRQIDVAVGIHINDEESDSDEAISEPPFFLNVAVHGEFHIGEEFPDEHITDWARRNAPLILMPFVREHVYALTVRSGFKPLILPLFEVPTLAVDLTQAGESSP